MPKIDPKNLRTHDKRNLDAIKDSLEVLGAGRSILLDNSDTAIAGNGTLINAEKLGIPIKIIESDGSELIAIKRMDLSPDDPKRTALAIADNRTTDLSIFDTKATVETLSALGDMAKHTGFSDAEIKAMLPIETIDGDDDAPTEDNPEIPFSEELLESHNYVVLYFDNSVDWLQAQTLLDIKQVKNYSKNPKMTSKGVGRIINGASALKKLAGEI